MKYGGSIAVSIFRVNSRFMKLYYRRQLYQDLWSCITEDSYIAYSKITVAMTLPRFLSNFFRAFCVCSCLTRINVWSLVHSHSILYSPFLFLTHRFSCAVWPLYSHGRLHWLSLSRWWIRRLFDLLIVPVGSFCWITDHWFSGWLTATRSMYWSIFICCCIDNGIDSINCSVMGLPQFVTSVVRADGCIQRLPV